MKVAVVGAGYAGMALVWHLLQKGMDVTLFDGGQGASHVSTGLLHSAPGRHAKPTAYAEEGMQAALELLQAASQEKKVFIQNGILRIAITEEQKKDFGGERVWVPEGITVFSRSYLAELKKVCHEARYVNGWVKNLEELKDYDQIILSTGAESLQWGDLPLKKTIGQCLICRWKEPLPMSLLSYGHITPTEDPELCQIGSTYEHTELPDPKKALELLEKAALFYPPAKDFQLVEIRAGVRIAQPLSYKPFVKKINPKTWVFTGFGSRGLIYSALFAKRLVASLEKEG
jgi:glycine/D-amino acid oxidase-like deaminating enzyme